MEDRKWKLEKRKSKSEEFLTQRRKVAEKRMVEDGKVKLEERNWKRKAKLGM